MADLLKAKSDWQAKVNALKPEDKVIYDQTKAMLDLINEGKEIDSQILLEQMKSNQPKSPPWPTADLIPESKRVRWPPNV